jgi:hypothetical protein
MLRHFIFSTVFVAALPIVGWSRDKPPHLNQSDPKKMLIQIYGCAPSGCGYQLNDLPLSKELGETKRNAYAWSQRKSQPCIDGEPIWNGQEIDDLVAGYKLSEISQPFESINRARIAVTMYPKEGFELNGKIYKRGDIPPPDRTLVYIFAKENGAWVVDDILWTATGIAPQPVAESLRQQMLQCTSRP